MSNFDKRIVLGMSGGVDSSVCAYLLKQQGYEVIGLFMQNWDECVNNDVLGHISNEDKTCNVYKDFSDAKAVADKLGIEIHKVDFIKEYWDEVFTYVIKEYKEGATPNPDVLCNKYIKFREFLNYAKEKFNCSKIAMGHYANVTKIDGVNCLTKAVDENKDQTYFLCWLDQEQVDAVTFPIGNLTKDEVRRIAQEQGLVNWDKKDSTGICFIGERKFKEFLKNYITPTTGRILDVISNKRLGTHDGVMFYTIGQNRDLNMGGNSDKYFVCEKDISTNTLWVVEKKFKDKYLTSTSCTVVEFNWINGFVPTNDEVQIRFRHRQPLINGRFSVKSDKVFLEYAPTLSVAKGQFAVLYQGNICLGGGIIKKLGITNH